MSLDFPEQRCHDAVDLQWPAGARRELLGPGTEIYPHVLKRGPAAVRSPIDTLGD